MQRANTPLKYFISNHLKGIQMKKIAKQLALAGVVAMSLSSYHAIAQQAAAAPAAPEHTIVPKVSLYTEYEYRGISQTAEKPALQFNLDYSHSSGFYVGTWGSNISWISDTGPLATPSLQTPSANIEIDLYGGYKGAISGDLGFDVGVPGNEADQHFIDIRLDGKLGFGQFADRHIVTQIIDFYHFNLAIFAE